ncbi:MAG: sigma-70 family RNA polymerase sigma factor [Kofleriaceae bacterium]
MTASEEQPTCPLQAVGFRRGVAARSAAALAGVHRGHGLYAATVWPACQDAPVTPWWNQVIAASPASAHARLAHPGLGERVTGELAAAHARWPEAPIDDAAFAATLAARLATAKDLDAALGRLRVDDLFLAQWCASGQPHAIAAFEHAFGADLDAVLARFRRLATTADELRQLLHIKLFVAGQGRSAPRIADYSGLGFLQNWLRVTALRALVDVARSERARHLEELLADDDFASVPALGSDVGDRYSQSEIAAAIKAAFARAVAGLAPRQRNFLRHAHVDSLTLDQIAALYRIHRATVARTLAQARSELVDATRRELAGSLGVSEESLESVVRAADSRIDLSLSRVLRAPEPVDDSAEAP